MRSLLLLRGAPCSGKTTFVKNNNLEKFTLNLDEFRNLTCPETLIYDEETNTSTMKMSLDNDSIAWNVMLQVLESRMKNGLFTVIDATHNNNDAIRHYNALCEKYKYTLFYYEMPTTIEQILENNVIRSSSGERDFIAEKDLKRIHTLITSEPLYRARKINNVNEIMKFLTIEHSNVKVIGRINGNAILFSELLNEAKQNPDTLYIFTGEYFGKWGHIHQNELIARAAMGDDVDANYQQFKKVMSEDNFNEFGSALTGYKDFIFNTNGNHQIFKLMLDVIKNKQSNVMFLESVHERFIADLSRKATYDELKENSPMFPVIKDIAIGERNSSLSGNVVDDNEMFSLTDFVNDNWKTIVSDLFQIYKNLKQMARIDVNGVHYMISHFPLVTYFDDISKVPTCDLIGARPVTDVLTDKHIVKRGHCATENVIEDNVDSKVVLISGSPYIHQGIVKSANATHVYLSRERTPMGEPNISFVSVPTIKLLGNLEIVNESDAVMNKVAELYAEKTEVKKTEFSETSFIWYQNEKQYGKGRGKSKLTRVRKELPKTQSAEMNNFIQKGLDAGLLTIKMMKEHNLLSVNFNEDAFEDKAWNDVTMKARGLFIDATTGEVKLRSYNKFFNYKEVSATDPRNLETHLSYPVQVFHKYNGFLGIASVVNNELVLATKSQINGFHVDLFQELVNKLPTTERQALIDMLKDNNASAMFEVCHLKDSHIIKYTENHLYLLDFVHNDEIENFTNAIDCDFSYNMINKAKQVLPSMEFKEVFTVCHNWEDVKAIIESVNDYTLETEGFVLQDTKGFQFKLKSSYYKSWKFLRHAMFSGMKIRQGMSNNETEIKFLTWYSRNKSKVLHDLKENSVGEKRMLSLIEWRDLFLDSLKTSNE